MLSNCADDRGLGSRAFPLGDANSKGDLGVNKHLLTQVIFLIESKYSLDKIFRSIKINKTMRPCCQGNLAAIIL